MKKLLLAAATLLLSFNTSGSELLKYDEPAIMIGTLSSVKSNHPNPDFRGKSQPSILLNSAVSLIGNEDDEFNEPENNVKMIQLAYDKKSEAFIKQNKGKRVRVSCGSLFHAHTAHHTTKVLCDLEDIGLAN